MQDSPFKTSPSIIIAAVSAIFFCLAGIIAIVSEIREVNSSTSEPDARGEESGIAANAASFVLEKLASSQKAELARRCANCGVVDSITMSEFKGDGVAYAGRVTGKTLNKSIIHQIRVRMDNGTYRVVLQQERPVFHVGDKVKIVNGMIIQPEKATVSDNNGVIAPVLTAFTNRLF